MSEVALSLQLFCRTKILSSRLTSGLSCCAGFCAGFCAGLLLLYPDFFLFLNSGPSFEATFSVPRM